MLVLGEHNHYFFGRFQNVSQIISGQLGTDNTVHYSAAITKMLLGENKKFTILNLSIISIVFFFQRSIHNIKELTRKDRHAKWY